jgi:hypothetical protein
LPLVLRVAKRSPGSNLGLGLVPELPIPAHLRCGEGKGHPEQCGRIRLHAHENKYSGAGGSTAAGIPSDRGMELELQIDTGNRPMPPSRPEKGLSQGQSEECWQQIAFHFQQRLYSSVACLLRCIYHRRLCTKGRRDLAILPGLSRVNRYYAALRRTSTRRPAR